MKKRIFYVDCFLVAVGVLIEILKGQARGPGFFVEVQQHLLLQLILAVADGNRVIVAVEPVNQGLDGGLLEVPNVGGGLPGLLSHHEELWVDEAEGVNHDLSLHRLDGINHHCHRSGVEGLEALLGVDIHPGQPAPESWMGVVPSNNDFWPF